MPSFDTCNHGITFCPVCSDEQESIEILKTRNTMALAELVVLFTNLNQLAFNDLRKLLLRLDQAYPGKYTAVLEECGYKDN